MPPTVPPNVSASAGTTITANRAGFSRGISGSRGVRALSASRRRARVTRGARHPARAGAATADAPFDDGVAVVMGEVTVVIWLLVSGVASGDAVGTARLMPPAGPGSGR